MSDGILVARETDNNIIIKRAKQVLLSYVTSISQSPENAKRELLSLSTRIFSKPSALSLLLKMMEERAATGYFLKRDLKMSDPSLYRAMNLLLDEEFLVVAAPFKPSVNGGQSLEFLQLLTTLKMT